MARNPTIIGSDAVRAGVDVVMPSMGTLAILAKPDFEGVWLSSGDDHFGIYRQQGITFAQVWCGGQPGDVPTIAVFHDPKTGLMVQFGDGKDVRQYPLKAVLMALDGAPPA